MRILPIERIPSELWRNKLLRLPSHLSSSYVAHLERLGLKARSIDTTAKAVHGGKSTDETHNHFACRFAVSAGRVEYSTLGPCDAFENLSDAFLSTFSDGFVGLLDIPCGTGAMTATLVTTLIPASLSDAAMHSAGVLLIYGVAELGLDTLEKASPDTFEFLSFCAGQAPQKRVRNDFGYLDEIRSLQLNQKADERFQMLDGRFSESEAIALEALEIGEEYFT